MTSIKITTRCRSLGYGSTSQPERSPRGGLRIESVDRPDVTGGLATVEAEHDRACRVNRGHDWRSALFVGGRKVVPAYGTVGDALAILRETGEMFFEVTA